MRNYFGVEIDTKNMTLEELEEAQKKIRELYSVISLQIELRKMAERKHSSSN